MVLKIVIYQFISHKMITQEILDYGLSVFNNEKLKFEKWLDESNISLNNKKPRSLLFSNKGCKEVLDCLNRIEYGNFS